MADEDVTKKKGIYAYVLDGKERHLSIRAFTDNQKREAYENQDGFCPACGNHFAIGDMHADHITPWSKGGKTVALNCRMLCADDNRIKSAI
jgi:5-methylcytosine-specific restriction endonuclease McrA